MNFTSTKRHLCSNEALAVDSSVTSHSVYLSSAWLTAPLLGFPLDVTRAEHWIHVDNTTSGAQAWKSVFPVTVSLVIIGQFFPLDLLRGEKKANEKSRWVSWARRSNPGQRTTIPTTNHRDNSRLECHRCVPFRTLPVGDLDVQRLVILLPVVPLWSWGEMAQTQDV